MSVSASSVGFGQVCFTRALLHLAGHGLLNTDVEVPKLLLSLHKFASLCFMSTCMLVNVHDQVIAAFLRRRDARLLPLSPGWFQGRDLVRRSLASFLDLATHKASRRPENMCLECLMLGLEVFHGDGFSLQAELCDSFDDLSLVDMVLVQRTVGASSTTAEEPRLDLLLNNGCP